MPKLIRKVYGNLSIVLDISDSLRLWIRKGLLLPEVIQAITDVIILTLITPKDEIEVQYSVISHNKLSVQLKKYYSNINSNQGNFSITFSDDSISYTKNLDFPDFIDADQFEKRFYNLTKYMNNLQQNCQFTSDELRSLSEFKSRTVRGVTLYPLSNLEQVRGDRYRVDITKIDINKFLAFVIKDNVNDIHSGVFNFEQLKELIRSWTN
jgi:hypothetical protein